MGFFTFMYYQSFIATFRRSVGGIIEDTIQGLSAEEQVQVVKGLTQYLVNQGVIQQATLECFNSIAGK